MNAKNGIYNVIFGFLNQIVTISLGIIIPRLFLLNFGSDANGLVLSIQQIITYLTLFEAGVGAASLPELYRSISNNEQNNINSTLAAIGSYYKKTGVAYLLSISLLAVVYPLMVPSTINKLTISFIILLMGIPGAISYMFQGKYRIFMSAAGKEYVNINLSTFCQIIISILKIIILSIHANIILLQSVYCIISILQAAYIGYYVRKNFSWIDIKVKPNYDNISQKNFALVHQISILIFSNTDVIILTFACGTKVASVYIMYTLFFGMANTMYSTINSGFKFIVGQSFHKQQKNFELRFDRYEDVMIASAFAIFGVVYVFIIPFLKLYTRGISDINYIDKKLAFCFLITNLLATIRIPMSNIIDAAGHFKETQSRTILESSINLIVSIICVNLFGIYGVLLGTIIAMLYRTNDMILYANRRIINRSYWKSYKIIMLNAILMIIVISITNVININTGTYFYIIENLLALAFVVLLIFVFGNIMAIPYNRQYLIGVFKSIVKDTTPGSVKM
jgi:hypothetical protein